MSAPDTKTDDAPDDGVTRIAIAKPFLDLSTPFFVALIAANLISNAFLQQHRIFEEATEVGQKLLIVACIPLTTIPFVIIAEFWKWRCRRAALAIQETGSELTPEVAAEQVFRAVVMGSATRRGETFCKMMLSRGMINHTFVVHWHGEVGSVSPVRTPFEPVSIDETEKLPPEEQPTEHKTVELGGGFTLKAQPGSTLGDAPATRTRRLVVFLGLIMLTAAVLYTVTEIVRAVLDKWVTSCILPLTIMVMSLITIWGVRGLFATDLWFLVPGGVVVRRSRGMSSAVRARLFDRRKSVATVFEHTDFEWLLTLFDDKGALTRQLRTEELHDFLRAWMSPIPPPVERLVDFE